MGLYEQYIEWDVMEPLVSDIEAGRTIIDPSTQRVKWYKESLISRPWVASGIDLYRDCAVWHYFVFNRYRVIHPGCMACWKIVYKPKTLEETFAVLKLQKKMAGEEVFATGHLYHSKCGVEKRPYTGNAGGYAAFWYSPLPCGLGIARKVRDHVEQRISDEIRKEPLKDGEVIVKRGCTEYECTYSPSDKWEEIARHYKWDQKIKRIMSIAPKILKQRVNGGSEYPVTEIRNKREWIEHAATYGDMTYLKYTNGPLTTKPLNYKDTSHKDDRFRAYDVPCDVEDIEVE